MHFLDVSRNYRSCCDQHCICVYAKIIWRKRLSLRASLSYFAYIFLFQLYPVHYIKMINICICLLETARSLKFNARFNPTVFRIALLSLLLCTIYTRYITIKFNAPRLSPQLVWAIRVSRGHVSWRMFARVYVTEAFELYARKRTTEEKLICIFNADLACI